MKNKLVNVQEKILLTKRGLIETVFGLLKSKFDLEHSRHRSVTGFFAHITSTLIAYAFKETKPCMRFKKSFSLN